jgi:hypothetical protein
LFFDQDDDDELSLLSLANQGDTTLARGERGVYAASTFKMPAGWTFYALCVFGR